jgi:hypothetical protein
MLGNRVAELAGLAKRRAVLVAPFVKREALARLLCHIQPKIELVCVTRWRVNEIAAGASDLEVWPLIRDRGGKLLLRIDLHAKVYVFDERCLVGSANLTYGGFGWGATSNLEVLIEVNRHAPEVLALESAIAEQSVEVDDELFNTFTKAVDELGAIQPDALRSTHGSLEAWLPRLRSPEFLFDVYAGDIGSLPAAAVETAREDLGVLEIAQGLSRQAFEASVAIRMLQTPIIAGVDRMLAAPRRFGEITAYLDRHSVLAGRTSASVWQALMRWMRHFMPHRYSLSVPNYSEIMFRTDAIRQALRVQNGRDQKTDDGGS